MMKVNLEQFRKETDKLRKQVTILKRKVEKEKGFSPLGRAFIIEQKMKNRRNLSKNYRRKYNNGTFF
jgi:hypothetical protein